MFSLKYIGESKVNVVEVVPSVLILIELGFNHFLPKGINVVPGYPFTIFLISAFTGIVELFVPKYTSTLVTKTPSSVSILND